MKIETPVPQAIEQMKEIKLAYLKLFKPGIANPDIQRINKRLSSIRLAMEGLDKLLPVELLPGGNIGKCPCCDYDFVYELQYINSLYYCPHCGQAIADFVELDEE